MARRQLLSDGYWGSHHKAGYGPDFAINRSIRQVMAAAEQARTTQAEREREAAKVAAAAAEEEEAKGPRLALEEARRPFWRRWLG